MEKKLTLATAWKECLRQWKDVSEKWAKTGRDIVDLKREWLIEHGYEDGEVRNDCFFCEYNKHFAVSSRVLLQDCQHCPPKRILSSFSCYNSEWCWDVDPVKFYRRIVALNKLFALHKKKVKK